MNGCKRRARSARKVLWSVFHGATLKASYPKHDRVQDSGVKGVRHTTVCLANPRVLRGYPKTPFAALRLRPIQDDTLEVEVGQSASAADPLGSGHASSHSLRVPEVP